MSSQLQNRQFFRMQIDPNIISDYLSVNHSMDLFWNWLLMSGMSPIVCYCDKNTWVFGCRYLLLVRYLQHNNILSIISCENYSRQFDLSCANPMCQIYSLLKFIRKTNVLDFRAYLCEWKTPEFSFNMACSQHIFTLNKISNVWRNPHIWRATAQQLLVLSLKHDWHVCETSRKYLDLISDDTEAAPFARLFLQAL